jgi:hypothetical protein
MTSWRTGRRQKKKIRILTKVQLSQISICSAWLREEAKIFFLISSFPYPDQQKTNICKNMSFKFVTFGFGVLFVRKRESCHLSITIEIRALSLSPGQWISQLPALPPCCVWSAAR